LKEGMMVEEGELLGMIDPSLAIEELKSKIAKLGSTSSDIVVAEKTKDETLERLRTQEALIRQGNGAREEYRMAKLQHERAIEDEKSKKWAHKVAQRDAAQSNTVLRLHEIRA